MRASKTARLLTDVPYGAWRVRSYLGGIHEEAGTTSISYTATAVAEDISRCPRPVLPNEPGILMMEVGTRWVLWVRANTRAELEERLQGILGPSGPVGKT